MQSHPGTLSAPKALPPFPHIYSFSVEVCSVTSVSSDSDTGFHQIPQVREALPADPLARRPRCSVNPAPHFCVKTRPESKGRDFWSFQTRRTRRDGPFHPGEGLRGAESAATGIGSMPGNVPPCPPPLPRVANKEITNVPPSAASSVSSLQRSPLAPVPKCIHTTPPPGHHLPVGCVGPVLHFQTGGDNKEVSTVTQWKKFR